MCVCDLYVAGGSARVLQFMMILSSRDSSGIMVSTGCSSNTGPKPDDSSEKTHREIQNTFNTAPVAFTGEKR